MTIVNGLFDWATQYPGPDVKTGYAMLTKSEAQGVVYHSAEGYRANLLSLVTDLRREASWTGSNMKNGDFFQHYPVNRICWTNGSKQANIKFRGFESEGVAGEPLTAAQTANLTRIAQDMADYFGWPVIERKVQLWEHNEMTAFGSLPTACPSGRIPWDAILAGLENDMPLNADDLAKIQAIVKGEMESYIGDPAKYTQNRKVLEFVNQSDDYVIDTLKKYIDEKLK